MANGIYGSYESEGHNDEDQLIEDEMPNQFGISYINCRFSIN